ncbi:MAG: PspA/IM30 family protein [Desulfotomaculum sp.]|nr:PspA/IM30 family protein [Desulfotomaculum sp.]
MNILSRITSVVKSNINALLDKAEDPEKILHQSILEMKDLFAKAKVETAKTMADEKLLQKEAQKNREEQEKWGKRAELAVREGNDSLALEALQKKEEFSSKLVVATKSWEEQQKAVETFKQKLKELEEKIKQAEMSKNTLIAKKKMVIAQKSVKKTMGVLNNSNQANSFARAEKKLERIGEELDAEIELDSELGRDDLENKFTSMEKNDEKLLEQLEKLKKKVSPPTTLE